MAAAAALVVLAEATTVAAVITALQTSGAGSMSSTPQPDNR